MQKRIIKCSFLVVVIGLNLFSCTKEIDFDQADDLEISPIIESNLIFFDEPASTFLANNTETIFIGDSIEIELFNNEFIVDNLIKSDFVFEVTNSINKAFEMQVNFLNDADEQLHTFMIPVSPSADGSDVPSNHVEVFEGEALEALKNTSKIVYVLSLLPGGSVNETAPGRIKLKSKAIFYLNIGDSI